MVKAYRPETLKEALEILSQNDCSVIAGGTDLMVQRARGGGVLPAFEKPLLFIGHLKELQTVYKKDNIIHIGAGAIQTDLIRNSQIPDIFKKIIGEMAAPPTRNMASLGGNICNASPAGDSLPYLYAMDAEVVLVSRNNKRSMPIGQFITGPKKTDLKQGELLTEIRFEDRKYDNEKYVKIGQRKGMSLTKVSFLGMANIANGAISDIRIAWGSVAPLIVREKQIENSVTGKSLNEVRAMCEGLIERYKPMITPIDDARSSAKYRKNTALNLLKDYIENLK